MRKTIAIIGLEYVGLPLPVEFGKCRPVIGCDGKPERVAKLRGGGDFIRVVRPHELTASSHLSVTDDTAALLEAYILIGTEC